MWWKEYQKDENKNTKWENNRDKYGYMALNIWKKSGRNSAMYVAAWFICNLVLKTQNMPEI